jgi:acyl-[acyl-carrier-protein] desaturase
MREQVYRAYHEFFDAAERKRRWHPFHDLPWEKMDRSKNTEQDAVCIETFCGVELYVPDYTANGFRLTRDSFGHGWFQANWGYEESKHSLAFREYLIQSGLRTQEQYDAFEDKIFSVVWTLPFQTRRQMNCYGALQESATYLIYQAQKEKAKKKGNELLEQMYFFISRDEAAHMGFYRKILQLEMAEDRDGTIDDLAHVVSHFAMPGVEVIPEYHDRLAIEGVGITSDHFLLHGIFPLLKALGTTRSELVRSVRKQRLANAAQVPTAEPAGVSTAA